MGMRDNTEDLEPPRKRRRPAKSCDQCRNRKVRCDLNHPCGPCKRARGSLTCSYREGVRGAQHSLAEENDPQIRGSVCETVAADGTALHSPSASLAQENLQPQGTEANGHNTAESLQERLRALEEQVTFTRQKNQEQHALRSILERLDILEQKVCANEPLIGPSASSDPPELSLPPIPPRLRAVPEKTKFYGPSHWLHTAEKIHALAKFSDREVDPAFTEIQAELRDSFRECRNLRRYVKRLQHPRIPEQPTQDLISGIPIKAVCDNLMSCYYRTFEPIYRVVNKVVFKAQYDEFWLAPGEAKKPFLMQFVLVLAIGTTFYDDTTEFQRLRATAQTWIQTAQVWLTSPGEDSNLSLEGLQVFCLLLLAWQTNSLSLSPTLSAGSLLTMAMGMGLQRDPDIYTGLNLEQKEVRRRLWSVVVELVLQSCIDLGMPLLLSTEDFDTKPPLNINDRDLALAENSSNPSHPATDFTDTSMQLVLRSSLPLRVEIVRMLNGINQGLSYDKVMKLGTELQSACRDAAALFHRRKKASPESSDFHQKFVDMTLRKYILLLHKPFMIQAAVEPKFYLSRKVCLESCMVIASYIDNLDIASGHIDDFSRLSICGTASLRGPLNLDIIATMCLEVTTQLNEYGPRTDLDPLGALRKAARKPIIDKLEHIKEQLLQIIALGNASLKRYNFLAGILGQIHALEDGRPVDAAVYEAVKQSLKNSYDALSASQIANTPQDSIESLINAPTSISSESFGFDVEFLDPGQFFDPLSLFSLTEGSDGAQYGCDFLSGS